MVVVLSLGAVSDDLVVERIDVCDDHTLRSSIGS
jgi:hypothetical protein